MAELAQVTELRPEPPRACSLCIYATFGPYGVYCTQFHEDVDDNVAEECGIYEIDSMHLKSFQDGKG